MARLYQRKGSENWYLSYQLGGRQVRKSLKTTDRELAEQMRTMIEADLIRNSVGLGSAPIPADRFIKAYSDRLVANGSSEASRYDSTRRVKNFLRDVGKLPHQVTPEDVENFKAARSRVVSLASVRRDLGAIKSAFRQAYNHGILNTNPCERVESPRATRKGIRFLTPAEVSAVLEFCRGYRSGRFLVPIAIAAYAGLRRAEALHMDWEDIDLPGRTLHVRAKPAEGWRPKSAAERSLPISERLADEIEDRQGTGPIICATNGGRISRDQARHITLMIRKHTGIEAAGWQILRHTFASLLVSRGVPIFSVSKLLGHSSVLVTERHYAALAPNSLGEHVNKLDF